MKKALPLFTYLFLLVFSHTCLAQNHVSLFVDKSSSIEGDITNQEVRKYVAEIVSKEIKNDGDQLTVSFIYTFTSNLKNAKSFLYDPPEKAALSGNKIQQKQAELENIKKLKLYRKRWYVSVVKYIEENSSANSSSDIHGALSILNYLGDTGNPVRSVYYVSDLIPYSTEFKYYGAKGKKFSGLGDVEENAKSDLAKVMSDYNLKPTILSQISRVSLYLIHSPLSTEESALYMPRYWMSLFKALNIDEVQIIN